MNEYRCTRSDFYSDPKCRGHRDLSARQGHYVEAESEEDARRQMRLAFPGDSLFTVDLVREGTKSESGRFDL